MTDVNKLILDLSRDGFAVFEIDRAEILVKIQELIKQNLDIHRFENTDLEFGDYATRVKLAVDKMAESGLVRQILEGNKNLITALCGPDVDHQAVPHIRVSRPNAKTDVTGWHRDTYYGNSPYEVNIWFPVFPLPEKSGIKFYPGSHRMPARNVTTASVPEEVAKLRTVERGSVANQIGFLYAPQTEELVSKIDRESEVVAAPKLGQGIIFFASVLHAGLTGISGPRISIDTRVRNSHSPTGTKQGFYVPLFRGLVAECASEFAQQL